MSRSVSCQSPEERRKVSAFQRVTSKNWTVTPRRLIWGVWHGRLSTSPARGFISLKNMTRKTVYVYENKSSSLYAIYIRLFSACLDEHFHFLVQEVAVGKMLAKQYATWNTGQTPVFHCIFLNVKVMAKNNNRSIKFPDFTLQINRKLKWLLSAQGHSDSVCIKHRGALG